MKRFDIGVLGGGQLGRMLLEAGQPWGLTFKVLDPSEEAPCAHRADDFLCASLHDPAALRHMAEECHVLTIEIENVDATTLALLETEGHTIYPSASHIAHLQDKGLQKTFFKEHQLPTSPFVLLDKVSELTSQHHALLPAVCKLRKEGYDGKGVWYLQSIEEASKSQIQAPVVVEKRVSIAKELAVVTMRTIKGEIQSYAPVEMFFNQEAHVLDYLVAPAQIPTNIAQQAVQYAESIVRALGYVGVLAVEFFYTTDQKVLINELAPRVHNSGHHTRLSHSGSQFGQMVRILKGWPITTTQSNTLAAVMNLLGAPVSSGKPLYKGIEQVLAQKNTFVCLYNKPESRPYRKMGHVTLLGDDYKELLARVEHIKQTLRIEIV